MRAPLKQIGAGEKSRSTLFCWAFSPGSLARGKDAKDRSLADRRAANDRVAGALIYRQPKRADRCTIKLIICSTTVRPSQPPVLCRSRRRRSVVVACATARLPLARFQGGVAVVLVVVVLVAADN